MEMKFSKYQGTGNDFIMIDDLNKTFDSNDKQLIKNLCDRKFGIGSDGIILLQADDELDFYVDFLNPDGSRSFCGNGSRCAVQFAVELGITENQCRFNAIDGEHEASILGDVVELKMSTVRSTENLGDDFLLDTGSPHYVKFVQDVSVLDIKKLGAEIRYNDRFNEQGVNVNFVEIGKDKIHIRTYERGVEDETLSCGTGVTAAAIASVLKSGEKEMVSVESMGGNLSVKLKQSGNTFTDIWLCGPAIKVFDGSIKL
ncbi:MAG: diaminopimelate epimerase [Patiriisocius sp.]|jgi:diaminopimelate epimerase